jgi:hypothetical protein
MLRRGFKSHIPLFTWSRECKHRTTAVGGFLLNTLSGSEFVVPIICLSLISFIGTPNQSEVQYD